MDSKSRAEKIANKYWKGGWKTKDELLSDIAAQIEEAEREAFNNGAHDALAVSSCDDCFKKGFQEGYEKGIKDGKNLSI